MQQKNRRKEKEREGDRKRDGNLSYTRQGMWACVWVHTVCVCLTVMTLCLWAPTEYVYLPQQHWTKINDASLPHTPCVFYLFPLLCSNCLHSAFSLSHMCTDALSPLHIIYSNLTYREGSFFLLHSSLIFPPTCVAICLLMMQLEHHCQLPASDRERGV